MLKNVPMNVEELTQLVVSALEDIKAQNLVTLDVRNQTDIADVMVVATGQSARQVKALAANVVEAAKHQGIMPLGVEGEDEGDWVLVDLADVIVHVMLEETRALYDLESLWSLSPTKVGDETVS